VRGTARAVGHEVEGLVLVLVWVLARVCVCSSRHCSALFRACLIGSRCSADVRVEKSAALQVFLSFTLSPSCLLRLILHASFL